MESSEYKISLDLMAMSAPVSLSCRQGDTGRRICISLTEDGVPYSIGPGCYAVFAGKKPDGKILWNGCSIEGNTIIYEITEQTVAVVGWVPVQILLYGSNGKRLASPDFVLLVDEPVTQDAEVVEESANEITALTQLIGEATALIEEMRNSMGGSVSDEQIAQAVSDYFEENPVECSISPVAKTADMTQPVGVDENGQLWVAPIGGGSSSGGTNNPEVTTHGIVWDLVNVTSSNPIASVYDGASLVAVLTPADGCTLGDVTITMGGEVVTGAWNAETATVTIASVTGDVVISCAAVQQQAEVLTWVPAQSYPNSTTFEFTEIASPNMYIIAKQTETTGGTLVVDFDTDDASHIGAMFYLFKDGAPYKMVGQSNSGAPCTGNLNDTFSEYDPGYTSWAFANIVAPATYTIPDGCQLMIAARRSSASSANGNFDSNSGFCTWVMDGGMTFKITNDVAASEASALSVDDDYAMNYGISTLALVTEGTAATKTGIDSAYATVVEEAKNAWMLEANGDTDKIPLIIHTDQHGSMTKNNKLFPFLAEIVNWYDISKVINLGDTVSNWIDSDADHPWNSCEGLDKYLEAMADVPFSKRIEIFGNHDTWDTSYETAEDQAYLHKYFRNIYARRMDNFGSFVVKDDNYNVKYVVVSGFAYDSKLGGHTHYVVHPDSIRWVISELEKADGYDVILLSHVPFGTDTTTVYNPTDGTSAEKSVGGIAYKKLNELWSGRKAKTSGTVTDEYGTSYAFDFTSCDGELLCGLHGHMHEDGYYYIGDLMDVYFDGHLNDNASFFVLVDRANRQLNVWKVTNPDTGATCQNYQIPFDKPAE